MSHLVKMSFLLNTKKNKVKQKMLLKSLTIRGGGGDLPSKLSSAETLNTASVIFSACRLHCLVARWLLLQLLTPIMTQ